MQDNQKKNTEKTDCGIQIASPATTARSSSLHMPLFLAVALLIPLADQVTKWVIVSRMALHESIPVIEGVVRITRFHNSGIAFGFFPGLPRLFMVVIVLTMIVVLYLYLTIQPRTRLIVLGCALILGGAAGNLIDRIHYGYVVDFIDFDFWPAFNVADSAVSVGVTLLLASFWLEKRETRQHASNLI